MNHFDFLALESRFFLWPQDVLRTSSRQASPTNASLKHTFLRLPFVDLPPQPVAPTPANDVGFRPNPPPGVDLQACEAFCGHQPAALHSEAHPLQTWHRRSARLEKRSPSCANGFACVVGDNEAAAVKLHRAF